MPALIISIAIIAIITVKYMNKKRYRELEAEVLEKLQFPCWDLVQYFDEEVVVKSRQALERYDEIKFFRENKEKLDRANDIIKRKNEILNILSNFLKDNEYKKRRQYKRIVNQIKTTIKKARAYRIYVVYISSAGNNLGGKEITLNQYGIEKFYKDPSLLMGRGEYSKFLKEQEKEVLRQKQHKYYESVNKLIDFANQNRGLLIIKGSTEEFDNLITRLLDGTVNTIKKIKDINSDEWNIIQAFIAQIEQEIKAVVNKNQKILNYYESTDFFKIKTACEVLMRTQREFNQYITGKVESISRLFGTRITRNETINEDEYRYIRLYKKTVTPFVAEVSYAVFASAENNPIDYLIKYFYPDKQLYPTQIQKLRLLVEEIATLRDAKQIIENQKKEYQQYLNDVPDYVMIDDEAGFYSRLGFANIDEKVLVVEYRFSYTSGGGMAKRTFSMPMTEETIIELIKALEERITISAFTREQRALMTHKLREFVKKRDNFTCCSCRNSIHREPNLLLEIDHIIPVSKGGCTVEENLQTLCWKCNRAKSNKMING